MLRSRSCVALAGARKDQETDETRVRPSKIPKDSRGAFADGVLAGPACRPPVPKKELTIAARAGFDHQAKVSQLGALVLQASRGGAVPNLACVPVPPLVPLGETRVGGRR